MALAPSRPAKTIASQAAPSAKAPAGTIASKSAVASTASIRARKPSSAHELASVQRQKREKEDAEKRAALDKAEAARLAAEEKVQELDLTLQASREREAAFAAVIDSAGLSTITLGPHSWSSDKARKLLDEEETANAQLDELLSLVRSKRSHVQEMIAQQQTIQKLIAVV